MEASEYTFVFADLAGFTALTEAHGDDGGASVATRFHELTRAVLNGALLVKTLGGGVMVVAPSVEVRAPCRGGARQRRLSRARLPERSGRCAPRRRRRA